MSPGEYARKFGISKQAVMKQITSGKLHAVMVDGAWEITETKGPDLQPATTPSPEKRVAPATDRWAGIDLVKAAGNINSVDRQRVLARLDFANREDAEEWARIL